MDKRAEFIWGFYIYTLTTKDIKRDLLSFGILCSVEWYFHTQLSEQPRGQNFKGQEILGFLGRQFVPECH